MSRVQIPLQVLGANGGGDDDVTFTAGDAANDHYFDNTSEQVLLIMKNTNGSSKTATVISVADPFGRTGDKTVTCPATTGISVYGPFKAALFNQTTGYVHVDLTDATNVSFACVQYNSTKG